MTAASSTMHVAATIARNDEMDIDTAVGSSLSVSKRKISDIHDEDDGYRYTHSDTSFRLGAFPPASSVSTSISSGPSAHSISSLSVHNSANTRPKKKSALSRSVSSLAASSSNRKITPAVAIHGMQGTLNRLTDIMEQNIQSKKLTSTVSLTVPSPVPSTVPSTVTSALKTQAITLVQTRNDNLSTFDKTKLIRAFTKDVELAEVYLALQDEEVRQNWLRMYIEE